MGKARYNDLGEWISDLDKLRNNPNDSTLAVAIAKRVDNSKEEVRDDIKNYLTHKALLADNPIEAFRIIQKDYPDKILCVKSKEDPWFEV